jgi:hypothetical protein
MMDYVMKVGDAVERSLSGRCSGAGSGDSLHDNEADLCWSEGFCLSDGERYKGCCTCEPGDYEQELAAQIDAGRGEA